MCSPAILLYGRYEMIRIFSVNGLDSFIGSEGPIIIAMTADFPAFLISVACIILSRILLGRWVWNVLYFNVIVLIVALTQYVSAFDGVENLKLCEEIKCSGEALYQTFWRLLSGN